MRHGKKTVVDGPPKVGDFAVFRYHDKASRAHFCVIQPTYEAAQAEAVRLMADALQERPEMTHRYFVLEFAAMYEGGPNGFASLER